MKRIRYTREIDLEKWKAWIRERENNNVQNEEDRNLWIFSGGEKSDIHLEDEKFPGVWILLGKGKSDAHLVCLQVGQADQDIGREIKIDVSYLLNKDFSPKPKDYVNYFGEHMFSYEEHIDERRKRLYNDIAEKYDDLTFVCIAHGEGLKQQVLRDIESYAAYKTSCRYWVNGHPYREEQPPETIKKKREACLDKCEALFERIKKDYPEMADSLNGFFDALIKEELDGLIPQEPSV